MLNRSQDAFAILLAAHHPRSRLLGISTVHGNAPLVNTTYNTQAILAAINCNSVPVFRGSPTPLTREPSYATNYHGETGLDGVTNLPKPSGAPIAVPIESVASILLSQPVNSVRLVATGPLTNISKMLTASPQLAEHLGGLFIMGGAIGGGYTDAPMGTADGTREKVGNWTPFAEFNIYADPEAAHAVLNNKIMASKTTLIPLDLTHNVRSVPKVQELLFGQAKHKPVDSGKKQLPHLRDMMREILMFFAEAYKKQAGFMDGPPLHDPLAVYAALCPDAFEDTNKERWDVDVLLQDGNYDPVNDPDNRSGMTILCPTSSGSGVLVPRKLNLDRFWNDIDAALDAAGG